ncbi:hypothetical protein T492DRAFT_1016720 [Pavlovales sp. CCMP2436]|nr:hypothetical protein T492DRAFT_1016720 [Pavlovales sp. CCMP2436]
MDFFARFPFCFNRPNRGLEFCSSPFFLLVLCFLCRGEGERSKKLMTIVFFT